MKTKDDFAGWQKVIKAYQQPDVSRSVWQIINSYGGLAISWVLMYFSLRIGFWLTLLLALPAAGFLVRIFIIQHDCGHASFFKSRRANDLVGGISGVFTMTPYKLWRKSHAVHHAHHADLDDRGTGDVWTLTIDEYFEAPWWKKVTYRVFRNPVFLFVIAPAIQFMIVQRYHFGYRPHWKNGEFASVYWTNLGLLFLVGVPAYFLGFWPTMAIYVPSVLIASSIGTWLFYVQHQFEETYWEHKPEWDYTLAAMHGSSYYKLPRVIQWFTGNIGFHHIHHLSPRIPNYNLERCHEDNPLLQNVVQLTLLSSIKTVRLALWDETERRLVSFRLARRLHLLAAQV